MMEVVEVGSFHDQMVVLEDDLVVEVDTFLVQQKDIAAVVVAACLPDISSLVEVAAAFHPFLEDQIVMVVVVEAYQAYLVVLEFFLVEAVVVAATFQMMVVVVDEESFLALAALEVALVSHLVEVVVLVDIVLDIQIEPFPSMVVVDSLGVLLHEQQ